MWAQTKEEVEKKEEQEVDDLLDFFDSNQVADYSSDEQVQSILKSLKEKIQNMKSAENWKDQEITRIRNTRNNDRTQK